MSYICGESAHDNYFIKIRERRCIRVFLLYRRTKKRPKITISILFFLGLSFSFLELASFFLSSFGRNLKMATWLDCWRQQMTPRGKHLTYGLNSPFFAGWKHLNNSASSYQEFNVLVIWLICVYPSDREEK